MDLQFFGGRGASYAKNGKTYKYRGKEYKYGEEYTTLAEFGKVKVIKINEGSPTAPMETQTKGRIYATVNKNNEIKTISFYDDTGKRTKQIDLDGHAHNGVKPPHTHLGYKHTENGFHDTDKKEWKQVYRILRLWNNYRKGYTNGF